MPPKSEALRHSGGERRLFTSAIVTLYLEVELRRDKRPGTEQNKSVGLTTQVPPLEEKAHYILITVRDENCTKDSENQGTPQDLEMRGTTFLIPTSTEPSQKATLKMPFQIVLNVLSFKYHIGNVYNRLF